MNVEPLMLMILFVVSVVLLVSISVILVWKFREINPLIRQKKALQNEVEALQLIADGKRKELKDLDSEIVNAHRLIVQGDLARKWLEANEGTIQALEKTIDNVRERLTDAQEELIRALANVNDEYTRLTTITAECLTEEGKRNTLQQATGILETKINTFKKDLKDLEDEILQKKNALRDLERIVGETESKIRQLQREEEAKTLDYKARIQQLQREEETKTLDYKARIQQLQKEEEAKILDYKARIQQLQREEETKALDYKARIQRLQEEESRQREAVNSITTMHQQEVQHISSTVWDDLDRDDNSSQVKEKPSNENKLDEDTWLDENTWLNSFQLKLQSYGFVFHERMIKAFHTSLKCGDVSPFVVLSGISGTGKSLLPELYSTAAGMNFLSVAVQPRWDNPQDLLGYYNHMERRYKATELARLLWRADKYNNENKANADVMNLVLLDEMNLARVEYYLSDLLSKLEIRNGICPDVKELRRRAEIELEGPALLNQQGINVQDRRLFIDRNVLFAGTMNEDETTQMLSDKVIDRSNVLRFGRPNLDPKNQQKTNKDAFMRYYATDAKSVQPRITREIWKGWLTTNENVVDNDFTTQLQKFTTHLQKINEAFDHVGRPFAHRLNNAVQTYLKCYPGNMKDAFADQLEMKILPKLNGLQLDATGFEALQNTLSNIMEGDDQMKKAFEQSCDSHQDFFKWRGVMR